MKNLQVPQNQPNFFWDQSGDVFPKIVQTKFGDVSPKIVQTKFGDASPDKPVIALAMADTPFLP